MTTLPQLRERHIDAVRTAVRTALERTGWIASAAAPLLDCSTRQIERAIERCGLSDEYAEKSPGRGRPKSKS